MNELKAREFFSAYYEGSLDRGLREKLEMALRQNRELQAEYDSFAETMDSLTEMRHEEIEIPLYLSDRIATKLEEARARRQAPIPVWSMWVRGFAFSGLAAAAIFGAAISMRGGPVDVATAGTSVGVSSRPALSVKGSDVVLRYQASGRQILTITSNGETQQKVLDGQTLTSPLLNPNAEAAVFEVKIDGGKDSLLVVVPGSQRGIERLGQGTLIEFAEAFADFYQTPIAISVGDPTKMIDWSFEDSDGYQVAVKNLSARGYAVDQRTGGIIGISEH